MLYKIIITSYSVVHFLESLLYVEKWISDTIWYPCYLLLTTSCASRRQCRQSPVATGIIRAAEFSLELAEVDKIASMSRNGRLSGLSFRLNCHSSGCFLSAFGIDTVGAATALAGLVASDDCQCRGFRTLLQ